MLTVLRINFFFLYWGGAAGTRRVGGLWRTLSASPAAISSVAPSVRGGHPCCYPRPPSAIHLQSPPVPTATSTLASTLLATHSYPVSPTASTTYFPPRHCYTSCAKSTSPSAISQLSAPTNRQNGPVERNLQQRPQDPKQTAQTDPSLLPLESRVADVPFVPYPPTDTTPDNPALPTNRED